MATCCRKAKWAGLILLAAVSIGSAAGREESAQPASWAVGDVISIAIIAAIAAAMIGWAIYASRSIARRRAEEQEAAMMFEARMRSLLADRTGRVSDEPGAGSGISAGVMESARSPATAQAAAMPSQAGRPLPAQSVDTVVSHLQTAGLFATVEGTIFASDGKAEGKIVRLTNGKTAVILPYLESSEFLARQLRRFDLCIIPLAGEQVCVVGPLGAYIADHLAF